MQEFIIKHKLIVSFGVIIFFGCLLFLLIKLDTSTSQPSDQSQIQTSTDASMEVDESLLERDPNKSVNIKLSYVLEEGYTRVIEREYPMQEYIYVLSTDLDDADCALIHTTTDNTGKVLSTSQDEIQFSIRHDWDKQAITLGVGNHSFKVECNDNGVIYEDEVVVVMQEAPRSICENDDFEIGEVLVANVSDIQTKLVGTWQGCLDGSVLPFRIEVTFKDDTFLLRNIEVIENPGTLRRAGTASVPTETPAPVFKLNFADSYGTVMGEFIYATGVKSTISLLKLSADNQRLSFYIIGENGSGAQYRLVRVSE